MSTAITRLLSHYAQVRFYVKLFRGSYMELRRNLQAELSGSSGTTRLSLLQKESVNTARKRVDFEWMTKAEGAAQVALARLLRLEDTMIHLALQSEDAIVVLGGAGRADSLGINASQVLARVERYIDLISALVC